MRRFGRRTPISARHHATGPSYAATSVSLAGATARMSAPPARRHALSAASTPSVPINARSPAAFASKPAPGNARFRMPAVSSMPVPCAAVPLVFASRATSAARRCCAAATGVLGCVVSHVCQPRAVWSATKGRRPTRVKSKHTWSKSWICYWSDSTCHRKHKHNIEQTLLHTVSSRNSWTTILTSPPSYNSAAATPSRYTHPNKLIH